MDNRKRIQLAISVLPRGAIVSCAGKLIPAAFPVPVPVPVAFPVTAASPVAVALASAQSTGVAARWRPH